MTSPSLGPLTEREEAVVGFLRRGRVGDWCLGILAAVMGVIACAVVQGRCFQLPDEAFGQPQSGTAAASYCSRIDHWYRWLVFPAVAILIALLAAWVLSRRRCARRWALTVVLAVVIVNSVVIFSLPDYVPI